MKNICLLLILVFFSSKGFADNVEITIAFIDKINPPLILDPNQTDADNPGITIDILRKLEQTTQVKFIYKSMPWARCLHSLEKNTVDAVFHASFKKDRMKQGVYPMKANQIDAQKRLIEQTYYIYKHKNSSLKWDGKKFTNLEKPIGIIIDFSVKSDLQKMNLRYEEAPSILTNLTKLKFNRLGAVINFASQTNISLFKYPEQFKMIEKMQIPFRKKDKYLMFSHHFYNKHKVLAETIWNELKRMRESGELEKLSEKYLK